VHDRVAVATLRRRDQLARQAERPSGHTPKAPQKLPVPAPCPVALRWRRTMCQIPATTATKRAIRRTSQNAPINTDNTDITRRTTSTPPATTTAAFRSGWVLGGCCWIISTSFPLGGVWPGGACPCVLALCSGCWRSHGLSVCGSTHTQALRLGFCQTTLSHVRRRLPHTRRGDGPDRPARWPGKTSEQRASVTGSVSGAGSVLIWPS